jgi:hypothetical protein
MTRRRSPYEMLEHSLEDIAAVEEELARIRREIERYLKENPQNGKPKPPESLRKVSGLAGEKRGKTPDFGYEKDPPSKSKKKE